MAEATDERIIGVMIGILLAWCGNAVPKTGPAACAECGAARGQNMRRFAGWMLTLAGLLHALVWLFAPLEEANLLAMSVVGAATLLVLGRAAFTRTWV